MSMKRYSVFAIAREAMSYHQNWEKAWRSPGAEEATM
jgi:sarcosine oxidase subunit beta